MDGGKLFNNLLERMQATEEFKTMWYRFLEEKANTEAELNRAEVLVREAESLISCDTYAGQQWREKAKLWLGRK